MYSINVNCNKHISLKGDTVNNEIVPSEVSEINGFTLLEVQTKLQAIIDKFNLTTNDFTFIKVYKDNEYQGTLSYNTNFWGSGNEYGKYW